MARFTMLALVATLAAAGAKTHSPENSAELAAVFSTVRSGDTIKLKSAAYTVDEQLNMTKVFDIKVEGTRGGTTIKANKKTRILYVSQAQGISFKDVTFSNGHADVRAGATLGLRTRRADGCLR
jgi:hypothetical protein